jgi:hypothetical protein
VHPEKNPARTHAQSPLVGAESSRSKDMRLFSRGKYF